MRVLVTGGRNYANRDRVYRALDEVCDAFGLWTTPDEYGNKLPSDVEIIHGNAGHFDEEEGVVYGADLLADEWAISNWVPMRRYPASWGAHGKAAGPIRNQQMLAEGKPDIVVAFPGGHGTADMVRRAKKAGVRVIEVQDAE
jgi:hypothetical protein